MAASTSHPERGQVLPLLLIVLALATAAAVLVGQIAVATVERSRAQTAADAAALAGAGAGAAATSGPDGRGDAGRASGPGEAAAAAAADNGAELLGHDIVGAEVAVEVGYRRARAVARAEAVGPPSVPAAGGDREGLAPVLVAALARADSLLGRSVPVVSGHRTRAEQEALWEGRADNPHPVAPPGTSRHESGLAIDVPSSFVPALLGVASDVGLCQPLPESDPIHFEPCPPTSPA